MNGIKNLPAFIGAIWRGDVKVQDGQVKARDFHAGHVAR